jgi:hypothetical protein
MRRHSYQVALLVLALPVLAGLALISLRGGASSASTVAPSARPAAGAFASAYVSFLNGRLAASALPDATASVRATAASGLRAPAAYQDRVVLRSVPFRGVLGATQASAGVVAYAGGHTLEAELALGYAGSRWRVTALVPPDFDTVFSSPSPPAPAAAAPAVRAAARAFALAYAAYRTGARPQPPGGSPTIERQIAARQDPLAATPRTGAAVRLLVLALLAQGNVAPVDATVIAGGRRLAFTFLLQQDSSGAWLPDSFPVSQP